MRPTRLDDALAHLPAELRDYGACIAHLIDLKRAHGEDGAFPTCDIPRESLPLRPVVRAPVGSYMGSPAVMCLEASGR